MTGQRAGEIVAILTAAFPGLSLEPEAARLWTKLLSELDDGDIAEGTALGFARHARKPPTISEFREAYQQDTRRARDKGASERGLPEGPRDTTLPEDVREWMRKHEILKSI